MRTFEISDEVLKCLSTGAITILCEQVMERHEANMDDLDKGESISLFAFLDKCRERMRAIAHS